MSNLTLGQKRVGLTFNPSGDERVTKIKQLAAEAIDLLQSLRGDVNSQAKSPEGQRAISEAQTQFEQASMWGVKSVFVD